MDENGQSRDDLTLPKGTSDADTLAKQLQDDFDAGKELVVTVLKVPPPLPPLHTPLSPPAHPPTTHPSNQLTSTGVAVKRDMSILQSLTPILLLFNTLFLPTQSSFFWWGAEQGSGSCGEDILFLICSQQTACAYMCKRLMQLTAVSRFQCELSFVVQAMGDEMISTVKSTNAAS